jgi:hypothetical protein
MENTTLLEFSDLVVNSVNNNICSIARNTDTGCGSNEVPTGVDLSGAFLASDFTAPGELTRIVWVTH